MKIKVKTSEVVKVIKTLTTFLTKEDYLVWKVTNNYLYIYLPTESKTLFAIPCSNNESSFTVRVSISELLSLSKLSKKDQVDFVELFFDLENKTLFQKLNNGIVFSSSFLTNNERFEVPEFLDDLVYIDSFNTSLMYKLLQKQKDYTGCIFYSFGFLAFGERQASYISFAEYEEEKAYPAFLTAVQLNNLKSFSPNQEIGFGFSNSLIIGYQEESALLFDTTCFKYQVEIPSSNLAFDINKWKELKDRFEREKECDKQILEIENTKEIEKLISASKVSSTDEYDLCVLVAKEEGQSLNLYLYEDKALKNEISLKPNNQVVDFNIALRVKNLLSMLSISNNTIKVQHVEGQALVYSESDLDIETITAISSYV